MPKAGSTLRDLYDCLHEDAWRKKRRNDFTKDMKSVHSVLFHPFATPEQRNQVIARWMQHWQPCLFGRIAAAKKWLHYCILTQDDFLRSDKKIAERIKAEVLAWKRRSVRPGDGFSEPAHGFLLMAVSQRLALAAPDQNLKAFAEKLRELWGCEGSDESSGEVYWETLYLQNPKDDTFVQFKFSVDFFAAQGDRRWWHDHRIPGGIAFTANSVGHMRRYREWYHGLTQQEEWVLKTAMETIDTAAETPYGRATWLKPLGASGRPVVDRLACPFADVSKLKDRLQKKDWTRYGGYLHTDHSIRPEFFHDSPEPSQDLTASEYLEDFTYLYDKKAKDHVRFVLGTPVAEDALVKEIGSPESWVKVHAPARKPSPRPGPLPKPSAAARAADRGRLQCSLPHSDRIFAELAVESVTVGIWQALGGALPRFSR